MDPDVEIALQVAFDSHNKHRHNKVGSPWADDRVEVVLLVGLDDVAPSVLILDGSTDASPPSPRASVRPGRHLYRPPLQGRGRVHVVPESVACAIDDAIDDV